MLKIFTEVCICLSHSKFLCYISNNFDDNITSKLTSVKVLNWIVSSIFNYNTPKKDLSAVPPRGLSVVFALPVTVGFSVIPYCHSFRPDQGLVELAEADQQRTLIFFHMWLFIDRVGNSLFGFLSESLVFLWAKERKSKMLLDKSESLKVALL